MASNLSVNQIRSDRYVEFRIIGIVGLFLDLSGIALELCLRVSRQGGKLAADQNTVHVNGLSNTLFKSVPVFLNEKLVESCPLVPYQSHIRLLKNMKPSVMNTIGMSGYFHDDYNSTHGITQTYTSASRWEAGVMAGAKSDGVHTYFPLLLDLVSIDMYLLDSVDLRIRLEMANNNWTVEKVKLWVVGSHHIITPCQHVFDKTLYKTYIIGTNELSIYIN